MTEGDRAIEEMILRLCRARGPGKTICPSEVARALEPEEAKWRALLHKVRAVACRLSRDGSIAIYRKGKVIDPAAVRGVIRLGLLPDD